jgi:uncharacterized integral membrane protein
MLLRLLLLSPFLLVLVVFALANPQPMHIVFWPFDLAFDPPASLALLSVLGAGLFLGAMMLWVTTLGLRLRARRAERANAVLESALKRANRASPAPILPPPGTASGMPT